MWTLHHTYTLRPITQNTHIGSGPAWAAFRSIQHNKTVFGHAVLVQDDAGIQIIAQCAAINMIWL